MLGFLGLDRRKVLIGAAAELTTSFAAALDTEHGGVAEARSRHGRPARHDRDEPESEPQARPHPADVKHPRPADPVRFWNDARASGPCASARAVAIAQIVMADAVAAPCPVDYEALYVRGRGRAPDVPEAFVGGAAARILEYIFANEPRPYVPRTFRALGEIIEDINLSRVYLGVHFNFDCKYGSESGERVAKAVYELAYQRRRTNVSPEVSDLNRHRFRCAGA
jgi:hypothetical protein